VRVPVGSLQEQMEVEQAFAERGLVLPRTRAYWMGLRVASGLPSSWPDFTWEQDGSGGWRWQQQGRVLMCDDVG
jgi:hypothetical protein